MNKLQTYSTPIKNRYSGKSGENGGKMYVTSNYLWK